MCHYLLTSQITVSRYHTRPNILKRLDKYRDIAKAWDAPLYRCFISLRFLSIQGLMQRRVQLPEMLEFASWLNVRDKSKYQ